MREETERPQAVVVRHHHHALLGQSLAVIPVVRTGTAGEPSAICPYHHRQLLSGRLRGRPYVDVKAVLAWRRTCRSSTLRCGSLRGISLRRASLGSASTLRCAPASTGRS